MIRPLPLRAPQEKFLPRDSNTTRRDLRARIARLRLSFSEAVQVSEISQAATL